MRKFEKISEKQFRDDFVNFNVEYNDIKLPVRKTKNSAGYDFYIPFDAIINPNETILIPTGIKVIMNENEFLGIYVRSGLGTKYNLRMCNQVGIIDADYNNNIENEGHIFIKMQNEGNETVYLKKSDRIAQGIFQKYYITDFDQVDEIREGGLGSTN